MLMWVVLGCVRCNAAHMYACRVAGTCRVAAGCYIQRMQYRTFGAALLHRLMPTHVLLLQVDYVSWTRSLELRHMPMLAARIAEGGGGGTGGAGQQGEGDGGRVGGASCA